MLEVVTSRNALLYQDALADLLYLRRGASLDTSHGQSGSERDAFELDGAIHLLLTQDDGTVIGAHRLIPAAKPQRLSDEHPDYRSVRDSGERIVELSLTCVDDKHLTYAAAQTARKHLTVGLFEFCLRAGYEQFTTLIPTDTLFRFLVIGLDVKPLGIPVEIDGARHVAVIVTADRPALDALRMALGVVEPLVHYVGALMDDPLAIASDRARPLQAAE